MDFFQIELQEREEKKEREKKVEALRKKQEEKRLAEEAEKVSFHFSLYERPKPVNN